MLVEEKANVKQIIINNALELFSSKGYEGVTVSELVESAGITKPTLYYYFGSKEGVFEAVCRLFYDQLNNNLIENAVYIPKIESYSEDIHMTLAKVTNAYFSFAKKNEAFYKITLTNMSMPSSSSVFVIARNHHYIQFDIIDRMFKDMAKIHGNLKGKSQILTWTFIGTINSYIGLAYNGIFSLELNEKTVKELVHKFMHGIYA